jgi:DNA-binding GntR family transcriptional regulator
LSESIFSGEFAPGTQLPPVSKLQIRYSACYTTVHKALTVLAGQRVLLRTGTRYLVPSMLTPGSTVEVVLFTEGAVETNDAQKELIRLSEQQAHKIGARLVRYEHSFSMPFNSIELQRLLARSTVAGSVVDFWGLGSPGREQHFKSLLGILYACRKPIGIIDEVGTLELEEPMRSSSRLRIIAVAGYTAGADVGRYLLHSGHRRAMFLTTSSDQAWSQRRYAGLEQSFVNSGIPDVKVTLHQTIPLAGVSQLACAAAGLTRAEMEILFTELPPAELDQLLANSRHLARRLRLKPEEVRQIHRQAKIAIELFHAGGQEGIAERTRLYIFELIGHQYGNRFLQPTFEQLLSDRSITAWVAATDGLGVPALRYLREHSMTDMPKRISVIAFDNSLMGTADGLSSYDFDMQGRFHYALSFAAGRKMPSVTTRNVIEWPGILYQRQSSGRAPRKEQKTTS